MREKQQGLLKGKPENYQAMITIISVMWET